MKLALNMADIANAAEACQIAIEDSHCLIDSNLPPGGKGKKQRKAWTQQEREDYDEWTERIKRFRELRNKLLAIEKAA